MTQTSKKKSKKEINRLVDNIGKVYNKWIRKGIICPDGYTPTIRSKSDENIEDDIDNINLEVDEKERTETN
ncbi:MAG: hypothetical protein HeimC3_41240 [Candidatus Heimdallarchaeota archaeon LC_3]|nr:MAG: hypothetical protein HeimC3_41240 [Candidatus Heimdallarchaeota archaeon LC_3]